MRLRSAELCLPILVMAAGCGDDDMLQFLDDTGERRSPIVSGSVTSGFPSVGILRVGNNLCTATLVGKKTVLTAAHCISASSSHSVTLGGTTYAVTSTIRHPQWNTTTLANDIAVALLGKAPPITPSFVSSRAPKAGLEITLVGYGVTGESKKDAGTKRVAKNKIQSVYGTTFTFVGSTNGVGNTCYGDSGGPAFASIDGVEVQVGVTSAGHKPCGSFAIDTRVDAYRSWLKQVSGGDLALVEESSPPEVQITAPSSGAKVPLETKVSATVTDDVGVVRVELHVDGALSGTANASPVEFEVTLAAGAHTLEVSGIDASGNRGNASVVVTAEDSRPPMILAPNSDPPLIPLPASARGEGDDAEALVGGCNQTLHTPSLGPLVLLSLAGLARARRRARPFALPWGGRPRRSTAGDSPCSDAFLPDAAQAIGHGMGVES